MSKGIFITGTGTDIGKTYVTGLIVKKLRESGANAAYYKAAMSGNERRADGSLIPGDALQVKTLSGIGQPLEEMCPYVYETAVSPHLASRLEGTPVQMDRVLEDFHKVCEKYEYVTMEGSGGILCPLCIDEADIRLPEVVKACGLSCLLIADAGLGTINGVGLTAYYLKQQGIALKGIIFNLITHILRRRRRLSNQTRINADDHQKGVDSCCHRASRRQPRQQKQRFFKKHRCHPPSAPRSESAFY